jgi:serine protease
VPFLRPPDFDFSRVVSGTEFTPTGPWVLGSGQRVLFDADGHGTHVAGTVAQQTNNSFGFAGVANGVTLMPVKVCFSALDLIMAWGSTSRPPASLNDGCAVSDVIQGIRYAADNGAKVLNISIGGNVPVAAYVDALNYAVSRGAFVAISAGNSALVGNPMEYPAAYATDIKGVVAVGATTLRKTRALYSSFRTYVELAAPGGEGTGTGCAGPAEVVWQIAPNPIDLLIVPPRFDRYAEIGRCGTSMASPHVAGAAALLYSQGINNPGAIEAALENLAEDLGAPGRDPDFGFGLIDARKALRGLGPAR